MTGKNTFLESVKKPSNYLIPEGLMRMDNGCVFLSHSLGKHQVILGAVARSA